MNFVPQTYAARLLAPSGHKIAAEPHFNFGSSEYQVLHRRSRTTAFQASRWLDLLYRELAPALAV